jgi:hypothetical protein
MLNYQLVLVQLKQVANKYPDKREDEIGLVTFYIRRRGLFKNKICTGMFTNHLEENNGTRSF